MNIEENESDKIHELKPVSFSWKKGNTNKKNFGFIAQDVDNKVNALPGVNDVLVEVVWDPVWDQSMMSEDAKLKLGMF